MGESSSRVRIEVTLLIVWNQLLLMHGLHHHLNQEAVSSVTHEHEDTVQNQYTMLPYPPFSHKQFENEETHYSSHHSSQPLEFVPSLALEKLNHFLFKGKQNFTTQFRALVAGGGTGATTMFLAEQLNHTDAEIVYLDFSPVSLAIAKRRANIRNLTNIVWINDWIENIPHLRLGKFDFIESSGVLHHLKSPARGLNILHNCLKDEGGMNLMVYGRFGRTYVYPMQDLLSIINHGESSVEEEIQNVKAVIQSLPDTNVYLRETHIDDHSHLYDLYLHKRDVSYSFPDLLNFVKSAGLHFVNYDNFFDRSKIDISRYLAEPLDKGVKTNMHYNRAIAELISGDVGKHEIYVSKINNSEADINELDNVMYFYGHPKGLRSILDVPSSKNNGIEYKQQVKGLISSVVLSKWKDVPITWTVSPQSTELLHFLLRSSQLNQTKSIKQLFQNLKKRKKWKMSDETFLSRIKDFFFAWRNSGLLLLRNVNTPVFPKTFGKVLFSFKQN